MWLLCCRVVHINEPSGDAATNAYLLQYDSAHGTWQHECSGEGSKLVRRSLGWYRSHAEHPPRYLLQLAAYNPGLAGGQTVGSKELTYSQERDPAAVPWGGASLASALEAPVEPP